MSADNYYRIIRHGGRFYALMGFASDDRAPQLTSRDLAHGGYRTLDEAIDFAQSEYTEYGYELDDSVRDREPSEQTLLRKVHLIRRLHTREDFGDCVEDGETFPCPTIRILDASFEGTA